MPGGEHLTLDEIFGVGLTISLEYEAGGAVRFALSRVEVAGAEGLVVSEPLQGGAPVTLPLGTALVAYVKHGSGIYLVQARVSGRRPQPTPSLELTPSGPVGRRQQRSHPRLRIALIPTSVLLLGQEGPDERLAATILNLGVGGMLLRTPRQLHTGQRLRLVVELPDDGGNLDAGAVVLRVDAYRTRRGRGMYDAGCAFIGLPEQQRRHLASFVARAQTLETPTTDVQPESPGASRPPARGR